MNGLLDHIFENINIEKLDRSEIKFFTKYLSEIFYQNLTTEQKIRYQKVKVRLDERLIKLDLLAYKAKLNKLGLDSSFL